ncbi:MAG: MBOAT family O-acyltransferase [Nonlabens sp.]
MLFNSFTFLIFLPVVFALFWLFRKQLLLQNILILIASYVFYGWWDWRFLSLIAFSTIVDYLVALQIEKSEAPRIRKLFLILSLVVNLGFLGVFKYYNFFVESFVEAFSSVGIELSPSTLNIILPVGISFYTFQTLSYTIDVYRKELTPTRSLINFAAYVAFFPQLVAGPIERAAKLLPQFSVEKKFSYELARSGIYLIIWGFFKKVVVADNCAFFVNQIFENTEGRSSVELFLGAVLFAFQIYGDFSGYSDIAIGTARLFGFRLMTNFKFPYFSRDIAEFWRRWHISLSTWFRDYVYIPLGGSRGPKTLQLRNVMVIFLVSGFWHGANWTFLVWGLLHALFFIPLLLQNKNRKNLNSSGYDFRTFASTLYCFFLVTIAWIFFRAVSVTEALLYIQQIFLFGSLDLGIFIQSSKYALLSLICLFGIGCILIIEYGAFTKDREEVNLNKFSALIISCLILLLGSFKNQSDFIYFQF